MGLLMFLAVTASLLGYCQTDEKGKIERRDSRPPFTMPPLLFPPFPCLAPARPLPICPPGCGGSVERNTDFAFRVIRPRRVEGTGENGAVARERAAKINFYGRRHE